MGIGKKNILFSIIVPSIKVPNLNVYTKQHINWWAVSWRPITHEFVNGILLGYRITYHMTKQSGKDVGGEIERSIIDVNNLTYYKKVIGLENYATYAVAVAGFTIAGDGPSEEKLAGKFDVGDYLTFLNSCIF